MKIALVTACSAALACLTMASAETPAAYLKRQPKPRFRPGHTLPPLTRYGWTLPFDTRVEFAGNWGYCLGFGGYVTEEVAARLDDPGSTESKLCALAAADPERYALSVICSRRLPEPGDVPVETWTRDADGNLLNGEAKSQDGTKWHEGMKPIYSPEAPDSVWQQAGRYRAGPIAKVREKAPIAIVLNGGEYGLGVLGFTKKVWEKDPAILAAKGDRGWYEYISAQKARQELIIADAVRGAVPDRQLYIYYHTSGGTHRNRWPGWKQWSWGYEWMKPISDLASISAYYKHFNTGWTGPRDILTTVLNARGREIELGQPLSYNWLCAGWPRGEEGERGLGDIDRYMGFLKCYYGAGMLGGNAGYYAYPKGGFGKEFEPDQPPHWLLQMVALARVHALFSHLEPFLRAGDLLPGVGKHVWSKEQPAFEFPSGDDTVRIVARRMRDADEWLIAAWAAAGEDRIVTVSVAGAGELHLNARPAGSVYRVTREGDAVRTRLLDPEPLLPTATFSSGDAPPSP